MTENRISLEEIQGDLAIYFNWSANALVPINPGASDRYLKDNFLPVWKIAQEFLEHVSDLPDKIYRGIILREPATSVEPHKAIGHLSFSTDKKVAEHFANIKGFGSDVLDLTVRLGKYGYVIEYSPDITEILFHYEFLSMLPYAEAFDLLGMDGESEVNSLMKQKEITIIQPPYPFTNVLPVCNL